MSGKVSERMGNGSKKKGGCGTDRQEELERKGRSGRYNPLHFYNFLTHISSPIHYLHYFPLLKYWYCTGLQKERGRPRKEGTLEGTDLGIEREGISG